MPMMQNVVHHRCLVGFELVLNHELCPVLDYFAKDYTELELFTDSHSSLLSLFEGNCRGKPSGHDPLSKNKY